MLQRVDSPTEQKSKQALSNLIFGEEVEVQSPDQGSIRQDSGQTLCGRPRCLRRDGP